MDEDIVESVACALIHLGETSDDDWSATEHAVFLLQAIYEFGYELKPTEDITVN